MSSKFKTVNRDGWQWLVAVVGGATYWLHRQARVGQRMRPGQRARQEDE